MYTYELVVLTLKNTARSDIWSVLVLKEFRRLKRTILSSFPLVRASSAISKRARMGMCPEQACFMRAKVPKAATISCPVHKSMLAKPNTEQSTILESTCSFTFAARTRQQQHKHYESHHVLSREPRMTTGSQVMVMVI